MFANKLRFVEIIEVLYAGLAIMIVGMFLFMLPFAINKCEVLIEIGFLTFALGGILAVVSAVMSTMN